MFANQVIWEMSANATFIDPSITLSAPFAGESADSSPVNL